MKNFYRFYLLIATYTFSLPVLAQEACKVQMASIAGSYEGDCKKGKANGTGKASGLDQYEGEFKDGLPNGKGHYHWANGNYYDGAWVNGKRQGPGVTTYLKKGKIDSVVTGFWKKDEYVGENEKPYIIYYRSSQVVKNEIKFTPSVLNEIVVMVRNESGNMATVREELTPKAALTDVSVYKGLYKRLIELSETNKQRTYKLEDINFPFRVKLRIGIQEVDVEFFERGKYTVDIALNN